MFYLRQWDFGYRYKTLSQPIGWLVFVIQGELLVTAPQQWLRLGPGYVGLMPYRSGFILECTKTFLGLYFCLDEANVLNRAGLLTLEGDTAVKVVAELIRQELQKSVQVTSVNQTLFDALVQLVLRLIQDNQTEENRSAGALVQKAIQNMKSHLHIAVKVENLVSGFGLGYRQMSRYFQQILGQNPKQVYHELKLQRARQLLLETTFSATNIATELGFSSSQHFSIQFKKRYGIAPQEWRLKQASDSVQETIMK